MTHSSSRRHRDDPSGPPSPAEAHPAASAYPWAGAARTPRDPGPAAGVTPSGATAAPRNSRAAAADWPLQVTAPGNPGWEQTATLWLRTLVPARYAGYPTLARHPVVLARHAQWQLQHEIGAVRAALRTSRAELPPLGVSDRIVESAILMYAAELEQLGRLARGVRLVTRALLTHAPEPYGRNG
ncbi:hypothetical protein ACFYXL_31385 [Streptomyces tsukubensis]|uniref:hypothetical protein n=1 Tax=Streptomyces tsukubensis TaxID=83656 RepID=UPI00367AB6E4